VEILLVIYPSVTNFIGSSDDVDTRADWKPTDYVQMYLNKPLFAHISECTNVMSVAAKGKSLNTTPAEIECFIGAALFILCHVSVTFLLECFGREASVCWYCQKLFHVTDFSK